MQHFARAIARRRHMSYIKFFMTIVKPKGTLIRKIQDMIMAEVKLTLTLKKLPVFLSDFWPVFWLIAAIVDCFTVLMPWLWPFQEIVLSVPFNLPDRF